MNELNGVIQEFLVESYENLDQLDRDLVELEKDPRNHDRLSSVFRTIHTNKGTCGFFGFGTLEKVAHVGENLLSGLRDGILLLNNERTTALLALVDAVRIMLGNIEKTGSDGTGNGSLAFKRRSGHLSSDDDLGSDELGGDLPTAFSHFAYFLFLFLFSFLTCL